MSIRDEMLRRKFEMQRAKKDREQRMIEQFVQRQYAVRDDRRRNDHAIVTRYLNQQQTKTRERRGEYLIVNPMNGGLIDVGRKLRL